MEIKIEKSKIIWTIIWVVFITIYAIVHIFTELNKDAGIFFLWLYLLIYVIKDTIM